MFVNMCLQRAEATLFHWEAVQLRLPPSVTQRTVLPADGESTPEQPPSVCPYNNVYKVAYSSDHASISSRPDIVICWARVHCLGWAQVHCRSILCPNRTVSTAQPTFSPQVQVKALFKAPQFDELDLVARNPDGSLKRLSAEQLEDIRSRGYVINFCPKSLSRGTLSATNLDLFQYILNPHNLAIRS